MIEFAFESAAAEIRSVLKLLAIVSNSLILTHKTILNRRSYIMKGC